MTYFICLACLACSLTSCITGKSQMSSGSGQGYKEDLSEVRPKYTVTGKSEETNITLPSKAITPQKDVTKQLQVRLDTLAVRNTRIKSAQGFRVLVYAGNSSEEMKKVKLKLRNLLSEELVYDEYKQPTFRVKAGDCYSRLEAYYVLNKLIKDFPNAIIVPDQINIATEK